MIEFLLLIIPSLSSCSCRIWSLVFLILWFKCSILCLVLFYRKKETLYENTDDNFGIYNCLAALHTRQQLN